MPVLCCTAASGRVAGLTGGRRIGDATVLALPSHAPAGVSRLSGGKARPRFALGTFAAATSRSPRGGNSRNGDKRKVAISDTVSINPTIWEEPCDDLHIEFEYVQALKADLTACASVEDKVALLAQNDRVASLLAQYSEGARLGAAISALPPAQQMTLLSLPAIGQGHVLWVPPEMDDASLSESLAHLAARLERVEVFYSAIGGVAGYQAKMLSLILEASATHEGEEAPAAEGAAAGDAEFHLPCGTNLLDDASGAVSRRAAMDGLKAVPRMAELYPLGGAGDRLGLKCQTTGESLPVAMLPYAGRTLLEGLVRDVQAREYLYYRTMGEQHVTPVAIMTSQAKGNHARLSGVCEAKGWFGRGKETFRLFKQPMVPLVAAKDAKWLLPKPFGPKLKPGGHGAIWKLMLDEGVFDWLKSEGREATLVRQISNPMAGTDVTLLALAGTGAAGGKKFGFASCERPIGNAEGVNVLTERRTPEGKWTYGVSNVEYTEFDRIGLEDAPHPDQPDSDLSRFPANTNVLYVDCAAAEGVVASDDGTGTNTLPGMIVNLKKATKYTDCRTGESQSVKAGRLECTMQNLADSLTDEFSHKITKQERQELSTFVLYNKRSRVTSSAKRKLKKGDKNVHQTPQGSFLDLLRNGKEMLERGGTEVPTVSEDVNTYLRRGPNFIFLFHPALGPLWDVAAQKIRGGSMAVGSELRLEVAEVDIEGLHVDGSLLVEAENIIGHMEGEEGSEGARLTFSEHVGRVRARNVCVTNAGVEWESKDNVFWQAKGSGELDIADCTVEGDVDFDVSDGHRLVVRAGAGGKGITQALEELEEGPSWEWRYDADDDGTITLEQKKQ